MTRGPASDKETRSEEASDLLSEGWPSRKIVKHLAEKYGCSAQTARSYVREGRELLVEAVAPSDRAFMFAQVLAGLQQDRLDAKEAGNISAQVGASKAMVNHLKQIAHIDPMRDFEQAFFEAAAQSSQGSIPKIRVNKTNQELATQQAFNNLGKGTVNRIDGESADDRFVSGLHD
jgi:hypothetical protein